MKADFLQLNLGWNAEPNAPDPQVETLGNDIVLCFYHRPQCAKKPSPVHLSSFLRLDNLACWNAFPLAG
jgi:hypothetical protein